MGRAFQGRIRIVNDSASGQPATSLAEPRLLRFTVDGRFCYAMKWSDELTENRREVNFTIRKAGEDEILCLLADCPLRITGTPDVVSVIFTGQKIIRAETEWQRAAITWEGGEIDDEGLVRVCSPDVFRGRSAYQRSGGRGRRNRRAAWLAACGVTGAAIRRRPQAERAGVRAGI